MLRQKKKNQWNKTESRNERTVSRLGGTEVLGRDFRTTMMVEGNEGRKGS